MIRNTRIQLVKLTVKLRFQRIFHHPIHYNAEDLLAAELFKTPFKAAVAEFISAAALALAAAWARRREFSPNSASFATCKSFNENFTLEMNYCGRAKTKVSLIKLCCCYVLGLLIIFVCNLVEELLVTYGSDSGSRDLLESKV
uniref:Uncharacterized protein n=1 Tax=Romanomermis culicivorax TaxID=13658 RepID=A0A915JIX4_ROMCU